MPRRCQSSPRLPEDGSSLLHILLAPALIRLFLSTIAHASLPSGGKYSTLCPQACFTDQVAHLKAAAVLEQREPLYPGAFFTAALSHEKGYKGISINLGAYGQPSIVVGTTHDGVCNSTP